MLVHEPYPDHYDNGITPFFANCDWYTRLEVVPLFRKKDEAFRECLVAENFTPIVIYHLDFVKVSELAGFTYLYYSHVLIALHLANLHRV